ncbi:MAG: hypothetical protein AABZ53_05350 [Planctomycetota bacterium]
MNTRINHTSSLWCVLAMAGTLPLASLGGCGKSEAASHAPLAKAAAPEFVDTSFGFRVTPPIDWRVAPPQSIVGLDKVVKVWATKDLSTIVAFTQEPGVPVSAGYLLNATVGPMTQRGFKVSSQGVVNIAGTDAMSVKLSGPGTGIAIGPGNVRTYQHWIAIPKGNRVLVLMLTTPDATKDENAKAFEEMVQSLKLDC